LITHALRVVPCSLHMSCVLRIIAHSSSIGIQDGMEHVLRKEQPRTIVVTLNEKNNAIMEGGSRRLLGIVNGME
jgi:hypothetical protein